MQAGDRILAVNGEPVADYRQFQQLVPKLAEKSPELTITVARDGRKIPLQVVARREALEGQPVNWIVGVGIQQVVQRFGPVRAFRESLSTTWSTATQTFQMIGKMLTGRASTKNLSGVIGIAQVANQSASMGPAWFLNFLGMVSLSLCILNLLPIPLLDGGHLLYYLIELVKGSPVSERTMIAGQYVGLALLFMMMGLAFYNDLHRILLS
jgi:regulator of sigma E protease